MTPCRPVTCSDVSEEAIFLSFFLSLTSSTYYCNGRGLLLERIIFNDTPTPGSTSLDEGSARRRDWQHTQFTTDEHLWPRPDSNAQSQQARGRRPTPQTARPLESPQRKLLPINSEYTIEFKGTVCKKICDSLYLYYLMTFPWKYFEW
jgi:hypothetical protein